MLRRTDLPDTVSTSDTQAISLRASTSRRPRPGALRCTFSIGMTSPTDDVYLDEPWLLMRWDGEHRCVFAEWKAFATSSEFQGALKKALEVVEQRHAVSFVNDTRKLELVSDEDQRWLRYTWGPLVVQAGVKRLAVVIAQHGLSRMAIEEMMESAPTTDSRLESRTFDSVADAFKWVADL
jgi:hypothetical protein